MVQSSLARYYRLALLDRAAPDIAIAKVVLSAKTAAAPATDPIFDMVMASSPLE